MRAGGSIVRAVLVAVTCLGSGGTSLAQSITRTFTNVTVDAGLAYEAGWQVPLVSPDGSFDESRHIAAGAAAADVDGDGWLDLYVTRGDVGRNLLFRNRGDGTFEDVSSASGAALDAGAWSGVVFADVDGDGAQDLFVGGVGTTSPRLLRGGGDGTFEDVTDGWGLAGLPPTFSASFGDVDRDGDLDLALAHWAVPIVAGESTRTLWRNDGGRFVDVSVQSGVTAAVVGEPPALLDLTFTPIFSDVDDDGWLDLLIAGDFGTSLVLQNSRDGRFVDRTDRSVVTDENGMGAAVGDFDGDGLLDWFVTSIWDPDGVAEDNWGVSGNRLYRGRGDGTFDDVTDIAGVRRGYWGWGAVAADLDGDADLDLVHVNGFGRSAEEPNTAEFWADPTRVFVNDGAGRFTEESATVGLLDSGMGRAIVAFDYDRDGDLDLFVANGSQPGRLLRNDGGAGAGWLAIRLRGRPPNTAGIGARITVETEGALQVREVRAGNNFESADPSEVHVGLGAARVVQRLRVRWPGGDVTELGDVAADRMVDIEQPPSRCGDGMVQSGWPYTEPCDGGVCCTATCAVRPDLDADGVCDAIDRCPAASDPDQVDGDDDGLGDACDPCTSPALQIRRASWRRRGSRRALRLWVTDASGRAPIWSARETGVRVAMEAADRVGPALDVTAPPTGPWRIRGNRAATEVGVWGVRVRRTRGFLRVDLRGRDEAVVDPAVEETGTRVVVVLTPSLGLGIGCAERLLEASACRAGSRPTAVRCRVR